MYRIKDTHCLSLFHKIRVAGHPILVLPDSLAHEEHLSKPSLVLLKEIRHLSFPLLSMVPIRWSTFAISTPAKSIGVSPYKASLADFPL